MNVSCPHCGARYLLPASLLGPGGARVRCPGCSRSFDVPPAAALPEVAPAAVPQQRTASPSPAAGGPAVKETPRRPSTAAATAAAAVDPGGRAPEEIASELLAALRTAEGESLSVAASKGSLFSQHGPAIFEAFDEFRRRAPGAGTGPFRAAMRELWGVDLPEVTPRP
jgi:predicted Zn finger-like uncharacterized protein